MVVPGAEYSFDDAALFMALETIVHEARISATTAALIATELEAVGTPWLSPEVALEQAATRLPNLRGCYSPRQAHAQLLLVVSMLLTIVCARLQTVPSSPTAPRLSESGIRPRFVVEGEAEKHKKTS